MNNCEHELTLKKMKQYQEISCPQCQKTDLV